MLVVRLGGFYGDLYENSVDRGRPVETPDRARKHRTAGDAHSFIESRINYWCGAEPQIFLLLDHAPACEHPQYAAARIAGLREIDGEWHVLPPRQDAHGRWSYPKEPQPIPAANGVHKGGLNGVQAKAGEADGPRGSQGRLRGPQGKGRRGRP